MQYLKNLNFAAALFVFATLSASVIMILTADPNDLS